MTTNIETASFMEHPAVFAPIPQSTRASGAFYVPQSSASMVSNNRAGEFAFYYAPGWHTDGTKKTYSDIDIYTCFGLLRREFSEIAFLCKGSKVSVYPSAMASQMSSGLVAYDVTMSEPDAELVRIFDYEENNLTNDINEQIAYRNKWAESLQTR